jgi:Bacterial SH3 domain
VSYRRALLLAPLLAGAPVLHAETLYVIDQLVVNVNSAPDATGARVTTIKSGDAVEVLERQGDQIHVHLANGTEGWVRKSYLSEQEPLQHRLNERNAEVEKLKQDVARLESEVAAAKAAPHGKLGPTAANTVRSSTLGTTPGAANAGRGAGGSGTNGGGASTSTGAGDVGRDADSATTAVSQAAPEGDPTASEPAHEPPYFMTPPDAPARPVWHWALGSFVVALGLGFVLGWQMLDRRIRRKYGGLRIY